MDRADLERLDRETLIARAEAAGVARARILTRPELIDEILIRSAPASAAQTRRARGLFGIARDLVARVVERGLHLPDAADRIRGVEIAEPARSSAAPVPTVTLAEIYAAQGHRERAVDTLKGVLDREPEHAPARALLTRLEDKGFPIPDPAMPPEEEEASPSAPPASADADAGDDEEIAAAEPKTMLDDAPLPGRYDVDECVAIPVDPTAVFVYWEVRDATIERFLETRSGGTIALRVLIIVPTWDGPRTTTRDQDVHAPLGEWFVRDLPAGALVRAAVGWRSGDAFTPIAHSPALETPADAPSPVAAQTLVRWTPSGVALVTPQDADAQSIGRAIDAFAVAAVAWEAWSDAGGGGGGRAPGIDPGGAPARTGAKRGGSSEVHAGSSENYGRS